MRAVSDSVLIFPEEYQEHKYFLIHFNFFIQYAAIAGLKIKTVPSNDRVFIGKEPQLTFSCIINDKQAIFDYSDHHYKNWKHLYQGLPYFKFQTSYDTDPGIIPLGPPIVGLKLQGSKGETMRSFFKIKQDFNYAPGDMILSKQLPNGAALERRQRVQQMLKMHFENVDTSCNEDQIDFWRKHENCRVAICVPGATNNMIDRGQMELFGLGVCTISPQLNTRLPFDKVPIPNVHYLQCKDDYSDLKSVIRVAQGDNTLCKSIGNGAQNLFNNNFSPKRYWKWIIKKLST